MICLYRGDAGHPEELLQTPVAGRFDLREGLRRSGFKIIETNLRHTCGYRRPGDQHIL